MMHSHDVYEQRARALRHRELRAFVRSFASLIRSAISGRPAKQHDAFSALNPVNDREETHNRAA